MGNQNINKRFSRNASLQKGVLRQEIRTLRQFHAEIYALPRHIGEEILSPNMGK